MPDKLKLSWYHYRHPNSTTGHLVSKFKRETYGTFKNKILTDWILTDCQCHTIAILEVMYKIR